MGLMHTVKKSKKILKSALVLVMAFLVGTTTLTQAYATYFSITVEHIWKDNGNKYGKGEEAPANGSGPRNQVGDVEFEVENKSDRGDYKDTSSMSMPEKSVNSDGAADVEGVDTADNADGVEAAAADDAGTADNVDGVEAAAADDAGTADNVDGVEAADVEDAGTADNADDVEAAAADDAGSTVASNDIILSMDLDVDADASPETVSKVLADDVAQQLDTVSDTSLSDGQTEAVAAVLADAIVQSEGGEEKYPHNPNSDVWTDELGKKSDGDYKGTFGAGAYHGALTSEIKGALTEKTQENLKKNGYETELTITIKIAQITRKNLDGTYENYASRGTAAEKAYVSTDGGNNWVGPDGEMITSEKLFTVWENGEVGAKDENGNYKGWSISECKFSFVHIRAASYDPKPEDPKDPPTDPKDPPTDPKDPPTDPKDPPTDPKDPPTDPKDPPTDPKDPPADPKDPVIPEEDVPLAELPEEEVPLAEEPEEEPEEVEIPEEDVPLSEIPKTGDNSFLWMCAALLSGAALLVVTRRKEEAGEA